MRQTTLVVVLSLIALAWCSPAAADIERGWMLRVGAPWVDTDLDFREVDNDGTRIHASGNSGYGLGIVGEYRFSEWMGFEIGAMWNENDMDLEIIDPLFGTVTSTDTMQPLTLSVGTDIHLTPGRRADLYFGPVVAYMQNNDLTFQALGQSLRVNVDNEFAWGGVVGLDVAIGERGWYFCSSVRYLDAEVDATPQDDDGETVKLAFDPLAAGVGFGYRF